MTSETEDRDRHEYPGGVFEDPGGRIPLFLKLTYIVLVAFGILYFILYVHGDGSTLVEILNGFTGR